jgi:hypothetical protein
MDGLGRPEKQKPAPAATGRRPNCKASSKSHKYTTPRHVEAQDIDRKLSVYDGTTWVGDIRQDGRRFDAFSTVPAYRFLGSFHSLKEASDAVSAAYEAAL